LYAYVTAPIYNYTISLHDALPISNKKLFKRIMNNPSKTIDITPPKEAEEMSSFLGRLNEIKPNGEILEVIQDPMNNGIWDILYRSEEHTSELQSRFDIVCSLLLEK